MQDQYKGLNSPVAFTPRRLPNAVYTIIPVAPLIYDIKSQVCLVGNWSLLAYFEYASKRVVANIRYRSKIITIIHDILYKPLSMVIMCRLFSGAR
jgi:hypothetical protein